MGLTTAVRRGAVALAVGCATMVPSAASEAGPPPPPPPERPVLSLRAPSTVVEVPRFGGVVWLDVGAALVAGDEPFELHTKRASYNDPITATWVRESGNVPLDVELDHFRGLPRFFRMVVSRPDGSVALDRSFNFCASEGEASRLRPDAPAMSPYPSFGCPYHPFTLGSVMGIQEGWGVHMGNASGRLQPGRYSVTMMVTKQYRQLFGLELSDVQRTVRIRVVDDDGCPGCEIESADAESLAQPADSEPARTTVIPPGTPMPDLRSLPAFWAQVDSQASRPPNRRDYLMFGANVWNAGESPLVVDGFRREDEDLMDAYQYFFDSEGNQVGHAPAGTMEWDARRGHHHWHFTDFARYRLLDADKQAIVRSRKEAFCLANTDAIDYTVEGANWQPENTDLHTACGNDSSLSIREVLDSGSGDTYVQSLPGQSFNITSLPNGVYYIEVMANPAGRLHESNMANNVSYRKVILGGTPGHRTVRVPQVGLVEEGDFF